MTQRPEVEFGDDVRIASAPETQALGYAGRSGSCVSITTPSLTGVEVIGDLRNDRALNVHFDEPYIEDAWFSPELVEFVDRPEEIVIQFGVTGFGETTLRRDADGSWSRE
jgi:hypothetical protein